MNQLENDAHKRASVRELANNYPYTPSIASVASSSNSSIFSNDGKSSQSSAPSSVKSGSSNWDIESNITSASGQSDHISQRGNAFVSISQPRRVSQHNAVHVQQLLQPEAPVAAEFRVNPRRTQPTISSDASIGKSAARAPPTLVRQCDRKDNFVESLVDTATTMIEVIWPLSVLTCDRDSVLGGKNLIGLRTFIQEVLKRSKTSYSTLQVALYYLVLIKSRIPKVNFTQVQTEDTHATRAMQCGRRMFLAALILASKYLQDRNYSARAWSKISGLKVSEINANEMAFVSAVDWNLHVTESRFQRWTDVVLQYSLSQPTPPSFHYRTGSPVSWKLVIPRLTPELDDLDVDVEVPSIYNEASRHGLHSAMSPAFLSRMVEEASLCRGPIPTSTPARPQALEPTPCASKENFRFPPISPRITQLPTPVMTPRTNGFCAPAAGVGCYRRGQSMSDAMKQIIRQDTERCTTDPWPCTQNSSEAFPRRRPTISRRPSYALSASSTISSPESMVSDMSSQSSCSSRTSRSSSVCSVASSIGALPQPTRLAVQATRRCATMAAVKEQVPSSFCQEFVPPQLTWTGTNVFAGNARESYVRGPEIAQADMDTEAALVLKDLSNCQSYCDSPVPCPKATTTREIQRKRERPTSICDASLEAEVRALLPKTLEELKKNQNAVVIEDIYRAKSFLLDEENRRLPFQGISASHIRSASGSRDARRKRNCSDEAWAKADTNMSPLCY